MSDVNDIKSNLGTKWLSFYTYGFLPFRIVAGLVPVLAQYDKLREAGYSPTISFQDLAPSIIWGIFTLVVLYGLHKRQMWGWTINWVYLFAFVLGSPVGNTREFGTYVVAIILLGLVFLLPNFIYFKKRKVLFQ